MIRVRTVAAPDARAMAELLNEIIRAGGTTALTHVVTRDILLEWIGHAPDVSAWHLAEDETGALLGFQYIEPDNRLPPEACNIATFVKIGQTGLGIGSRLFERTMSAARDIGYRWINATIRADNESGLTYYQSRGFETYARHRNIPLDDGQVVDKIAKRYDL